MKNIFFFLILFFTFNLLNAAPTSLEPFCSSSQLGWSKDSCISPCSELTIDGSYGSNSLGNGSVGFCYGQATVYKFTLKKIQLGVYANTSEKCTIYEGNLIVDSGTASPGTTISGGVPDFSSCKDGVIYDTIYLTTSRITDYAANTNYPDSSGSVARTTSYCSSATLNNSSPGSLPWLDVMSGGNYNDASKCHVRESVTWNTHYQKAASSPTTTDFSSSTNVTKEWDEWKSIYLNSISDAISGDFSDPSQAQTDSEGYFKEYDTDTSGFSGSVAAYVADYQSDTIVQKLTTDSGAVDIFGGYPFDSASQHEIEISIFAQDRNQSEKEYGALFYFLRNGATAEFIGTNPSNSGIYLSIIQLNQKAPF